MTKISKISSGIFVGLMILSLGIFSNPLFVKAASSSPATSSGITCPENYTALNGTCMPNSLMSVGLAGSTSLMDLILQIIKYLLYLAGVIAVVFLIYGGFLYVSSGGNEEQAEKGRKALIKAVIGVVVIILSYAIITIVTNAITGREGVGSTTVNNNYNPNNLQFDPSNPKSVAP